MKSSITQEFEYGCGIACLAFAAGMTYQEAAMSLGPSQARSERFWCRDLIKALASQGLSYKQMHIKAGRRYRDYPEGTIALLRRSRTYPVGHYLIRQAGTWMDPWINMAQTRDIEKARSGYRRRLPGAPMYLLLPKPATPPGD